MRIFKMASAHPKNSNEDFSKVTFVYAYHPTINTINIRHMSSTFNTNNHIVSLEATPNLEVNFRNPDKLLATPEMGRYVLSYKLAVASSDTM
ncbi:hypothetical protein L1987_37707 [Smallanthus sonchifolius]|uniref:Uncharacterized protein n=1 Tax=Smallanthus sonchifolius TaxID=185202 RepID=A0ACB9HIC0_9ASTR|nr:hypothetical protein L1987_37707 [Smallanthus sonchifolius]